MVRYGAKSKGGVDGDDCQNVKELSERAHLSDKRRLNLRLG